MATFVFGLDDNSRIKRKISGQKLTLDQILLARICDELAFQSWAQTKDGQKNRNRPTSVLNSLLNSDKPKENECNGYADGEEFKKAWLEITQRGNIDG